MLYISSCHILIILGVYIFKLSDKFITVEFSDI